MIADCVYAAKYSIVTTIAGIETDFEAGMRSTTKSPILCREITAIKGSKNFFLPGSKLSTFVSAYALSPSFPIYRPILSHILCLLLSFPSVSFLPSFSSLLFPFLPFLFSVYPYSLLGNLSISATFLAAPLPCYFVF